MIDRYSTLDCQGPSFQKTLICQSVRAENARQVIDFSRMLAISKKRAEQTRPRSLCVSLGLAVLVRVVAEVEAESSSRVVLLDTHSLV